uniref:Uncharacterized protein n=1 Tax=Schistocephalus solidus TaxID=70667 RepID=A0A0X3P7C6_SCHSO
MSFTSRYPILSDWLILPSLPFSFVDCLAFFCAQHLLPHVSWYMTVRQLVVIFMNARCTQCPAIGGGYSTLSPLGVFSLFHVRFHHIVLKAVTDSTSERSRREFPSSPGCLRSLFVFKGATNLVDASVVWPINACKPYFYLHCDSFAN